MKRRENETDSSYQRRLVTAAFRHATEGHESHAKELWDAAIACGHEPTRRIARKFEYTLRKGSTKDDR